MEEGPPSIPESLRTALNITSLTNICFKQCIVDQYDKMHPQPSDQNIGNPRLSEEEKKCMTSCVTEYMNVREFMEVQFRKDWSYVTDKNQKLFY